jgi:hypothetical protein
MKKIYFRRLLKIKDACEKARTERTKEYLESELKMLEGHDYGVLIDSVDKYLNSKEYKAT